LDGFRAVYVADKENHTLRIIDPSGKVSTLAGLARKPGSIDGRGGEARFNFPDGVVVNAAGHVFVADLGNHTIRRIDLQGIVTTLAGQPGQEGDMDGTGRNARFRNPKSLAIDNAGNLYVGDRGNYVIRRVTASGQVTTIAGKAGHPGSMDGPALEARFGSLEGITWDGQGTIYVADAVNSVIRRMERDGGVTTLAGSTGLPGYNNGFGREALFCLPSGIAADFAGNLFVADTLNYVIRKIDPKGEVTTIAGLASSIGYSDGTNSAAPFDHPQGVAVDILGNVYVTDQSNNTIRKINPLGGVTTLAGVAPHSEGADGAGLLFPQSVAVTDEGEVFMADSQNHVIRRITALGSVSTLAGQAGSAGSIDGTGSAARFFYPQGVAVDKRGNVWVADSLNHTLRKINQRGEVTTVAGLAGSSGSTDGIGSAGRHWGRVWT
jgi:sugar lactone lactonase YvrE